MPSSPVQIHQLLLEEGFLNESISQVCQGSMDSLPASAAELACKMFAPQLSLRTHLVVSLGAIVKAARSESTRSGREEELCELGEHGGAKQLISDFDFHPAKEVELLE